MKTKEAVKPVYYDSNTGIDWNGQPWTERTFSHPERTVRIATAFSGIGSPEMALEQLGVKHRIVFACDIDKDAKKSYFANYPITVDRWCNDVKILDATQYRGQVDIFVAGVCCQSWSKSGKMKGYKDPRGKLFDEFVRVITECAPKVFIFENVDNIVYHDNGKSWPMLLDKLNTKVSSAGLNYHYHWRILNASDYGIPQHRNRIFFIGFLDEAVEGKSDFLYPAPIKLEKCVKDYLDDKTPGKRYLTPRERIRLMGFPDSFKKVVSDTAFSKQAGNSIVVDVMKALFRQMDITRFGEAA